MHCPDEDPVIELLGPRRRRLGTGPRLRTQDDRYGGHRRGREVPGQPERGRTRTNGQAPDDLALLRLSLLLAHDATP